MLIIKLPGPDPAIPAVQARISGVSPNDGLARSRCSCGLTPTQDVGRALTLAFALIVVWLSEQYIKQQS